MPHVSFNKLRDDQRKALYRSFVKALEKSFATEKGFFVLQEFLTYTEREMFAKRLAVITLLKKEVPVSKIASGLKMSRVTIDTMVVKYEAGKYANILNIALKEKGIENIIDTIFQNMNTAGGFMPPYINRTHRRNH